MSHSDSRERQGSVFSASAVLDAIAEALTAIRVKDRLTFDDLGAVLGKSPDQAAKYCAGNAAMDAITYARANRAVAVLREISSIDGDGLEIFTPQAMQQKARAFIEQELRP